jgi:uncharacterized protein (TIGR02646 family)
MIKIHRDVEDAPEILTKPFQDGQTEKEKAIDWYKHDPQRTDSFNFQRYSDRTVRVALGELFHGKCAYCESRISNTQPPDVEHFRPKSAVMVGGHLERPGYYWLAADWDNLLPSCIDCNRARKHEVADGTLELMGKANLFPVTGERVTNHDKDVHEEENCLLLHPCHDDGLDHLEFTEEGIVRGVDEKGKVSTEVLALNRNGLNDARRATAKSLVSDRRHVRERLERLAENDLPKDREGLSLDTKDLFAHAAEDQEYSGMARQIISRALEEYRTYAQANLTVELQAFFEEQIAQNHWPASD